jgi:serine/threonine-protein kinase
MIGQTLGHYRILQKIGEGGMGVVYRARDERLERDVALKILPAGVLADEAAHKRFRKEALALSKLNHPNIATIYDFDTDSGVDFLAMEYVAGGTLSQKLLSGALPEKEAAGLGVQVAEALEEAHEQGIVHRDLKPGNILVTPKGRAKVLDFGLAKLLRPVIEMTTADRMSETRAVAGTLPYMAPEQLRGEAADARTDLYALGAVLYEMGTGQRPFCEELVSRLTDSILHQIPVPPRALNSRLSPELERIVLKCLEKEPENRYQSVKEVSVDLRRLGATSTGRPTVPAAAAKPSHRRMVLSAGIVTVLLLGVLLAINVGGWREWLRGRTGAPRIESLAVLPLANLSGDSDQEYFVDGMTEELIAELSKIGALRVISRTSIMQYKGARRPLGQIARELNVDAVVEGSVMRSGDRVRITAQLIQAANDKHLWAESYEREPQDVLALQSEVAQAIAQQIQVTLTLREHPNLANARPLNAQAHEAYLKGRYYWNKRKEEGYRKGIDYFNQALEVDPNYALAYVGLADSYLMLSHYGAAPPKETLSRAEAAAKKALELDDTLAEGHASLAHILSVLDWDRLRAEKEYQRALALNPNYATAHHWFALHLSVMGRHKEAIAEMKRARELDPLSLPINVSVGYAFMVAGEYDQAIAECGKTLEIDPNFAYAYFYRGRAYLLKGMYKEAVAEFKKALELSGVRGNIKGALGYAYAVSGNREQAERLVNELRRESNRRYILPGEIAIIYTGLGDKDRAFEWLEKAYEDRSDWWLLELKVNPMFDTLRPDPRFQDLARRVGLPP